MDNNSIIVPINGDPSGLTEAIQRTQATIKTFAADVDRQLAQVNNSVNGVGASFAKLALGMQGLQTAFTWLKGGLSTLADTYDRLGNTDAVDSINALQSSFSTAFNVVANLLAPALTSLLNEIALIVKAVAGWVDQNKGLVAGVGAFLALTAGFAAVASAWGSITAAITACTAAVTGLSIASMTNPFFLAAGSIAAVVATIVALNAQVRDTKIALTELQGYAGRRESQSKEFAGTVSNIKRLKDIQGRGALTDEEQAEAKYLIDSIKAKYGVAVGDVSGGRLRMSQTAVDRVYSSEAANQTMTLNHEEYLAGQNITNLRAEQDQWLARWKGAKTQAQADEAHANYNRIGVQIAEQEATIARVRRERATIEKTGSPIKAKAEPQTAEQLARASDAARAGVEKARAASKAEAEKQARAEADRVAKNLEDFYDMEYSGDATAAPDNLLTAQTAAQAAVDDLKARISTNIQAGDLAGLVALKDQLDAAQRDLDAATAAVYGSEVDTLKREYEDKRSAYESAKEAGDRTIEELAAQQASVEEARAAYESKRSAYESVAGRVIAAQPREERIAEAVEAAKITMDARAGGFSAFQFSGQNNPILDKMERLHRDLEKLTRTTADLNTGVA